jgi:hypothetical protein
VRQVPQPWSRRSGPERPPEVVRLFETLLEETKRI